MLYVLRDLFPNAIQLETDPKHNSHLGIVPDDADTK